MILTTSFKLVERPHEAINIELKSWIDPENPEGEQKIARAALALRNQNGGYLVIGFNDKTGKPDPVPAGVNVRLQYHTDDRLGSGYSLTILERGGFQRITEGAANRLFAQPVNDTL